MANTMSATRSNYFHVKDPDAFRKLMSRVVCGEDSIDVWEEKDEDGNPVFGFGVSDIILGVFPENRNGDDELFDDDYDDFETFCGELRKHIADDDACIIMSAGHEKLRYVFGNATIITKNSVDYEFLADVAIRIARNELDLPTWRTKMDY